ncbi:MAG: NAD kinase [Bifidobacteriaceae bacterium]|jgi:NAD+ kinase|nr:NAD kinase [Bifidobacteriaceae bacterium]
MSGRVLVIAHSHKSQAGDLADFAAREFTGHGWEAVHEEQDDGGPFDLAIVLGGDGTLLRAAEAVRGRAIALLGVNVGRMGFFSVAEPEDLRRAVGRIVAGDYRVESRATVVANVTGPDGVSAQDWALNEVTVEKALPRHMLEVMVLVDGRPMSTFGCDGVVLATPTGSTGHAFSAGGPVVWPEVEAMLVVPVAAHALFARPLVVSSTTAVTIAVQAESRTPGVVSFDSRRGMALEAGGRLEVRNSAEPVRLVRFGDAPFVDRLVHKFSLPVTGWRSGAGEAAADEGAAGDGDAAEVDKGAAGNAQ